MKRRSILNHFRRFIDAIRLRLLRASRIVQGKIAVHRTHWVMGVGAACVLGMVAVAIPSVPGPPPGGQNQVVETLDLLSRTALPLDDEIFLHEERIVRGDSFDRLLVRLGIHDEAARRYLLNSPEARAMHQQLVPGRVVSARTREDGMLIQFIFPMNGGETVTLVERRAGKLTARLEARVFETRRIARTGEIRYSLFGATDSANIPDAIAVQMAEIFSGDIDFHRDLRQGDRFTLIYELQYYQGLPTQNGRILSVEFTNKGKTHQAFYFEHEGKGAYYTAEGGSLKKAFLRSPLEFSRVTSGFAMRLHPIFKTWRAHTGIDYGAPTGTRVRATGDGVVEFIGTQKGYGNFVLLSHAGGYQTAYAHLNGFASALKKGSRVSQGDIIAYVGSTGWATGPHLHYEFRIKGKAIDPLSISVPTSIPLTPTQKTRFKDETQEQRTRLALLKNVSASSFE
jgi:murein DD-endopeptidase MepM/ murein hydrolase activator NlpD